VPTPLALYRAAPWSQSNLFPPVRVLLFIESSCALREGGKVEGRASTVER